MTLDLTDIKKYILSCKNYKDLFKIWKLYPNNFRQDLDTITPIKIVIASNSAMMSMKLRDYLTSWYVCNVKIFSQNANKLLELGCNEEIVYSRESVEVFDLILILHFPDKLIPSIFPYSNKFNTFDFVNDFPLGVDNLGLFLINAPKGLKNPYPDVPYSIANTKKMKCFTKFIREEIKNFTTPRFKLFIPDWLAKNIIKKKMKVIGVVEKYYDKIIVIRKNDFPMTLLNNDGTNVIYFDSSIFPLSYEKTLALYKFSGNMLLNHEQDVINATSVNKKVSVWKATDGECVETIFDDLKKWDFRKLGRKVINQVMNMTLDAKKNIDIARYGNVVLENLDLDVIKKILN